MPTIYEYCTYKVYPQIENFLFFYPISVSEQLTQKWNALECTCRRYFLSPKELNKNTFATKKEQHKKQYNYYYQQITE